MSDVCPFGFVSFAWLAGWGGKRAIAWDTRVSLSISQFVGRLSRLRAMQAGDMEFNQGFYSVHMISACVVCARELDS